MKRTEIKSHFKNIWYFLVKKGQISKEILIVLFLMSFGLIIPCFLALSPLIWESSDSRLEPSVDFSIWKGGNQHASEADFRVTLLFAAIDLTEAQSLKFNVYITIPIVVNGSIKDYQHFQTINLEVQLNNWGEFREVSDFTNFSDYIWFETFEESHKYPFDNYGIRMRFYDIENMNITTNDQIFFKSGCLLKNWKILYITAGLFGEGTDSFVDVLAQVERTQEDILSNLVIPLIILGGVFFTMLFTNPLAEFKQSDVPNHKEINSDIENNRNFRISTAKWILAFSFANLVFSESIFFRSSFYETASLTALFISSSFYFTSKYQGDNWSLFNFAISISAALICILTVFLSF